MKLTRDQKVIFCFLILLVILGQFGIDLYLASMPYIAKALTSTAEKVKLTIPLYLLGFSISQLIYGPISDAIGRKPTACIGLSIFFLGSIGCFLSQNITFMITFRCLQGLGAGAGVVTVRAMTRDVFEGKLMAKVLALVSMVWALMPMVAPVIGGYLQTHFGWRSNFFVMSLYSGLAFCLVLFFLKEVLQKKHQQAFSLQNSLHTYKHLFTNKLFLSFSFMSSLCSAYFLSFATASPFLLQNQLHLNPVQYGWSVLLIALGVSIGSTVCARLVHRVKLVHLICLGVLLEVGATASMAGLALMGIFNLLAVIIPPFVASIGGGLIFPNCTTGAITPYKKNAGMAGAGFGFIQMFTSFVFSFIMSHLSTNNAIALSIELLVITLIILILFFAVVRRNFIQEE